MGRVRCLLTDAELFILFVENSQILLKLSVMWVTLMSLLNIDILPNRQYIANTADSAQEQYS